MNQLTGIAMAQWRTYAMPCLAAGALQAAATLLLTPVWAAALGMVVALFLVATMSELHFAVLNGQPASLRESAAAAASQAAPLAVLLLLAGLIAAVAHRSYWGELGGWLLLPWLALAIPVCVLERRSAWESFQRCAGLTTGSRARAWFVLYVATNVIQRIQYRSTEGWMGHWGLWLLPIATAYCAAAATVCYQSLNIAAASRQS